jgi:HK97 family phage portal protein
VDNPELTPNLTTPVRDPRIRPSPWQLLEHLKATAWTCASINSAVCASFPPLLYVTTTKSQNSPRCLTTPIPTKALRTLKDRLRVKADTQLHQVVKHPILQLIDDPNPYMNPFDLWELTTLYQETIGSTFWFLERHPFTGQPTKIWPLPSQLVWIFPNPEGYTYHFRGATYTEEEIIHFRYPDPANPYGYGLSPLRAAFNEAVMSTSYAELKIARFKNRAAPDVIIAPKEAIGLEERQRLEDLWNQKFRQGGAGKAMVAESDMSVNILNNQFGDIAALAEKGKNSEDITNAFHIPLSMLSTNTNLANLQASQAQHAEIAIRPRLTRRDEKLNEQLVPLFDPTGRLLLAADDPAPGASEDWRITDSAAKYGWMTINELRDQEGLEPVPWGNRPCSPAIAAASTSTSTAIEEAPI